MSPLSTSRCRALIGPILIAACQPLAGQTIIATDGDVGWDVNTGGSAENPAVYIVGENGAYELDLGDSGIYVGRWDSDYNHLRVQSGSSLRTEGGTIGSGVSSNHNRATVTSSEWIIADRLTIGSDGSNNQLIIEEGSTVSTEWAAVGLTDTSHNNSVQVSGAGSSLSVGVDLDVGGSGTGNSLLIADGATVSAGYTTLGSFNSTQNTIEISGDGSSLSIDQWINIGGWTPNTDNILTIRDGGLLSAGSLELQDDNFIRLDGGFLALEMDVVGEVEALMGEGLFQLWDGADWTTGGANDFSYGYFADEASALAFSGYNGLAGFTIVTSAVPEPSTWALILGAGAVGLAGLRRRRLLRANQQA